VVIAIPIATVVLLVAFVLVRVQDRLAFTTMALLWTLTYRNSWGMVFTREPARVAHHALSFAPAADVWAIGPKPQPTIRLPLGDPVARGPDRGDVRARGNREASHRQFD
jgi:hypothetical protein